MKKNTLFQAKHLDKNKRMILGNKYRILTPQERINYGLKGEITITDIMDSLIEYDGDLGLGYISKSKLKKLINSGKIRKL